MVCALRLVNLEGRILQYGPLNLKLCFCALCFKIRIYNKYLTNLVPRSGQFRGPYSTVRPAKSKTMFLRALFQDKDI